MPICTVPDWPSLFDQLKRRGIRAADGHVEAVAGGDIAAAWRLRTPEGAVFLKTLPAAEADLLASECAGLEALASARVIRVPEVLAEGATGSDAWLALEWLELEPLGSRAAAKLGEALAELHRVRSSEHGWHRDNYIGRTPQPNSPGDDWPAFFRAHRLQHQLGLARTRGFGGALLSEGLKLCERLPALFAAYRPEPSLLHGDLWAGNAGEVAGEPVIFDPAVYYGDRESDIAMTRLFGGYPRGFYSEYRRAWPLDDGYERREDLYQLYHILNHLNLFGGGYLRQAERLIARLLAAL